MQIVVMLGGQGTGYKRERGRAVQRMVSEIYSAPRVTNEEGNAWDFTRADMRVKAKALVMREKPFVLIGSPPCTAFSSWQHFNAARMDSARDPVTPCGRGAPYSLLLRGVQAAGGRRALLPSRAPRQRHLVAI